MADKVGGIFISEVLADNPGTVSGSFDTDGDGNINKSDEFIELQNSSGSTVSLDGYEIWSEKNGLLYKFASGDTLAPGDTATVVGNYTGPTPPGFYDKGAPENTNWMADGEGAKFDTIFLVNTDTGEFVTLSYGSPSQTPTAPDGFPGTTQIGSGESIESSAPNGVSFARDDTGKLVQKTPTPGTPDVPCFTAGTLIATPDGLRPVEDLAVGDLVMTRDSGAQPIRWVASRTLEPHDLDARPELRPIAIEPRWSGGTARLLVSPQHGILVRASDSAEPRLARAVQLARTKGGAVRIARGTRKVTYVHFMLPAHGIVYANGVATESFYPGPRSIESLSQVSRLSLLAHFPGLGLDEIAAAYGPPAVPYTKLRDLPDEISALRPEKRDAQSAHQGTPAQRR